VCGAIEFALGVVIVVVIYRSRRTVWVDEYDLQG
jgi:NADH:ubiquinone oxidoreductase subunit K